MTTPTVPTTSSRRTLLAGSAGALAALVADAFTRPRSAHAAGDGIHVELGAVNTDTSPTSITNTAADGLAIEGKGTGTGVGVGVRGSSTSGLGILAVTSSASWAALRALSTNSSAAIQGYSGGNPVQSGPTNVGVFGYAATNASSFGMHGLTDAGRGVMGSASSGTGVYGEAAGGEGVRGTSGGSNGVAGESASGIASGVIGVNTAGGFGTYGRSNSPNGAGVFGEALFGTAVYGYTDSGVGVHAFAQVAAGLAFKAEGRVSFSTSGLANASPGQRSITVTPGTNLGNGSRILCTLESNQSGLFIHRTTKNVESNTFRVFLSAAVSAGKTARIAWFVIG